MRVLRAYGTEFETNVSHAALNQLFPPVHPALVYHCRRRVVAAVSALLRSIRS
ncbi:hypothetical protein AB0J90_26585 [Micromonospora sp. NPDC049523]|uniref:hypothetical protein n=1 Tax=Micromonospora sp. NPDC049523 TaxID=3155921 RepID=UPI0034191D3E